MHNGHNRRVSRGYAPIHDRTLPLSGRQYPQETPIPTRNGQYYERYPADRGYPGEYVSPYHENGWRGEHGYYDRTPSPERYERYRAPEAETWARWDYRDAPAPATPSVVQWPEPSRPVWPRPRRDSVPLFEPSDSWKASHKDELMESQPPEMLRSRDSRDYSPERPAGRDNFAGTPLPFGGNCYRPNRTWEESHSPAPPQGRTNVHGPRARQWSASYEPPRADSDPWGRDHRNQYFGSYPPRYDYEDTRSSGDHRMGSVSGRSSPSQGRPEVSHRAQSLSHSEHPSIASSSNSQNMSPSDAPYAWKRPRTRSRSPVLDGLRPRPCDAAATNARATPNGQPPHSPPETPPGLLHSPSKATSHTSQSFKRELPSPRPQQAILASWDHSPPALAVKAPEAISRSGVIDIGSKVQTEKPTLLSVSAPAKLASSPEPNRISLLEHPSPLSIPDVYRVPALSARPPDSPVTAKASLDRLRFTKKGSAPSYAVPPTPVLPVPETTLVPPASNSSKRPPETAAKEPVTSALEAVQGPPTAQVNGANRPAEPPQIPGPNPVHEDVPAQAHPEPEDVHTVALLVAPAEPEQVIDEVSEVRREQPASPVDKGNALGQPKAIKRMAFTAQTMADALRVSVMQRAHYDHQSTEERVEPILVSNLRRTKGLPKIPIPERTDVVDEVMAKRRTHEAEGLANVKASLKTRFEYQDSLLRHRAQQLRNTYLDLHERWIMHCSRLDEQDAVRVSTPSQQEEICLPAGGRTTRRTAATQGDAVRSDFDLQQIIENLGHEDMTDPTHLAARNVAIIPDMLSVACGRVEGLFDDTNNLVHDPLEFYKPRTGFLDWTEEEKDIFNRKFAAHPKQFGLIANALEHKTAAQCVAYYYLHKKTLIDFRKVMAEHAPGKRKRGGRKADKQKGNALLADIRKHDEEVSTGRSTRTRRSRIPLQETPTPTPEPELDPKPRKRRTARATLVGVEVADEDGVVQPKKAKRGRKPKVVVSVELEQSASGRRKASQAATWIEESATPARGSPSPDSDFRVVDSNSMPAPNGDSHSGTLDNRPYRAYQPPNADAPARPSSSQDNTLNSTLPASFNGQLEVVPMHPASQMAFPFPYAPFSYSQHPQSWADMRSASAMPFPHNATVIASDRTGFGQSAPTTQGAPIHPNPPSTPAGGLSPGGFVSFTRDAAYAYANRPIMPPPNVMGWMSQQFAPPTLGHIYPPTGPPQHFDYVNSAALHQAMPPRPPVTPTMGGQRRMEDDNRSFG